MNWYEQHTDEYRQPIGKQILKEYGASGYGAYIILKQIISENMNDDLKEWGYVPTSETMTSLAEKCGLSEAQFRLFITFCDDRFILEKREGRLFCPSLLEQKNNYAKKIERKNKPEKKESTHSTSSTHSTHKLPYNTTQSQEQEILSNDNMASPPLVVEKKEKPPKPEFYGNKYVNFLMETFKKHYGFPPTDKQPRRVSQNIVQIMQKHIRANGLDPLEAVPDYGDRTLKALGMFFDWVKLQRSLEGAKTLDILKRNIEVFRSGAQT